MGVSKYLWFGRRSLHSNTVEEAKKMNEILYKQLVQVSGLFGPQFLSYLLKRFTHLSAL